MTQKSSVIEWLLQGDPAIRWQAQRDLLGADEFTAQTENIFSPSLFVRRGQRQTTQTQISGGITGVNDAGRNCW